MILRLTRRIYGPFAACSLEALQYIVVRGSCALVGGFRTRLIKPYTKPSNNFTIQTGRSIHFSFPASHWVRRLFFTVTANSGIENNERSEFF